MSKRDRGSKETVVATRYNDDGTGDKLEMGHPESQRWETSFGSNELENLKFGGGIDSVSEAKAVVINSAFRHMGMGKYQWK